MKYNFASLRYIDKISIKDYQFSEWLSFIKDNLNFDIKNEFKPNGKLKQFSFNQVFELDDGSELQFTIYNGTSNKHDDLLMWETAILKLFSFDSKGLIKWLDKSHSTISKLFKEICKDDLYNSFK